MTDNTKNIDPSAPSGAVAATSGKSRSYLAWTSLAISIIAWATLLWFNGYIALLCAVVAAVAGFVGLHRSAPAPRRAAITAIIASVVLIAVVTAYLVVIKIGLS